MMREASDTAMLIPNIVMENNQTRKAPSNPPGSKQGGGLTVECRVCRSAICVEGRVHLHVVKCDKCNEATPIRAPPPGRKYVRCPCNCLLICKAASARIACPRDHCKRVITLTGQAEPMGVANRAPPGTCRVACAHCDEIFMFNKQTAAMARCPHCHRRSSVGTRYKTRLALWHLLGAAIGLIVSVAVIVVSWTWALRHHMTGLYVLWFVLLFVVVVLLFRSLYYSLMRVSRIEGPL